jgi:beta-galactosidase
MTIIGAQYYRPPNPPRADWARDLQRMRDAGMNTVKLWACWSWMEPRPGEYDFADLDELFDLAHAAGLQVVVNTILEDAPYWLEQRHPEARYRDAEDRPVHLGAAMNTPGGGWPGLCFDNDAVWDAGARFLAALVHRYDAHPALLAWDVWNEPHLEPASYFPDRIYCYCDASLARFGGWLRKRHGSIDALNAAWERRYSDWSQVAPPRIFESVPDLVEWREHWFANLAEWLSRRVAVVRDGAREGRTVMTHVALSGFTGQLASHTLDEFTLTDHVDVFGTSSFPTWLMADDHVEHLFNLETARDAARGKPFWQAELQGGRGRRNGLASTGQPHPAVLELWMWNALATGAEGVVFWQWRPELLGPESPGYGLTTPDGSSTARVAAATRVAELAAAAPLDGRRTTEGRVGLLLSRGTALHAFVTDRTMQLATQASLGGYRLLLDADLEVTTLHAERVAADGVPEHVTSIYWPMPAVADEALASALAAFVERGGRLVAESGPGEYEPLGRRRTRVPGAGLAALFGAREIESTSIEPTTVDLEGFALSLAWQRAELVPDDAAVVARFDDGAVAVTESRRGDGSAVLLASFASVGSEHSTRSGSPQALRRLLGEQTASGWVAPSAGLIARGASTGDGRSLRFLLNWTTASARHRVPFAASALTTTDDGVHSVIVAEGDLVEVPARSGMLLVAEHAR